MNKSEKIRIAELFHNTYESLAPTFGYETREDTKEFDPESKNGKLMIAVCNKVVQQVREERDREVVEEIKQTMRESNSLTKMSGCTHEFIYKVINKINNA